MQGVLCIWPDAGVLHAKVGSVRVQLYATAACQMSGVCMLSDNPIFPSVTVWIARIARKRARVREREDQQYSAQLAQWYFGCASVR